MNDENAPALPGRQREAARNDARILQAAREVFINDADAPIAAVAVRAGVGIGALYRRYGSKEEMLRQLSREGLTRYIALVEAALADTQDPGAAFATFMRDAVIASQPTDPAEVVSRCLEVPKTGIVYQKHMTQHMIDGFDTAWMAQVTNVFLIRAPERVLASYAAKAEQVTAGDIGFTRQRELFDEVHAAAGETPVVIDAADIRGNPGRMLEQLCAAIGIAYDPAMLSWPQGPHEADGVWAAHWYDAVWRSTGFAPPEAGHPAALPPSLAAIAEEVRPHYEHLRRFALQL